MQNKLLTSDRSVNREWPHYPTSQLCKHDEEIPAINTTPTTNGPITRSRAKQICDQVNAILSLSYNLDFDEMAMLSSTLLLVEFRNKLEG
jgi:hypothetical protein